MVKKSKSPIKSKLVKPKKTATKKVPGSFLVIGKKYTFDLEGNKSLRGILLMINKNELVLNVIGPYGMLPAEAIVNRNLIICVWNCVD